MVHTPRFGRDAIWYHFLVELQPQTMVNRAALFLLLTFSILSHAEDLEVLIRTDWYPGEATWTIKDACNGDTLVMSGGPYNGRHNRNKLFTAVEASPPSRYTFEISDSYGDGLCE